MTDEQQTIILRALKEDKCVIVVGPDFHEFSGKSFFGAMEEHFLSQPGGKYSNEIFFQTEEFIQPKRGDDTLSIQETISSFYEKQNDFDEPLKKMSRIPFSLIISLMPDRRLKRIFKDQKFLHHFDFFPVNGKTNDTGEQLKKGKSTRYKPLIYNLLGDLPHYNAVYSFDTMFSFLADLFKNDLPDVVKLSLENARVFIFWGVRFEKWHTQLLLKKIATQQANGEPGSYTTDIKSDESHIIVFIMERLNLKRVGSPPEVFMTELYEACEKENLFRKPPDKVFISYSHDDQEVAMSIAEALKSQYVDVIIDKESIRTAEKIKDFINRIKHVDIVMPIISEKSLFSPYVFKEIKTGNSMKKKLIPCQLGGVDFSNDLWKRIEKYINEQIASIPKDFKSEKSLWNEYQRGFSKIISQLTNIHVKPIDLDDIPGTVQKIIDDWKNIE